jgi:hypothetical protein
MLDSRSRLLTRVLPAVFAVSLWRICREVVYRVAAPDHLDRSGRFRYSSPDPWRDSIMKTARIWLVLEKIE